MAKPTAGGAVARALQQTAGRGTAERLAQLADQHAARMDEGRAIIFLTPFSSILNLVQRIPAGVCCPCNRKGRQMRGWPSSIALSPQRGSLSPLMN